LGCLPFIKDIRGKGLLIGIECAEPVADILQNIHEQGVLVVSAGPNVIRLVPSLNIPEEDVIQALSIICKAIQEKAAVHSGLV
ncbi:aminotransferase class III-fold pyridoxal phosphate-dependent enzyme, partial [Paenibacillus larvae]